MTRSALLPAAFCLWAAPATAQTLLADLATCTGQPLANQIVVAGLPNDQTALTQTQAMTLHREVEEMLRQTEGVGIRAARDASQLRGLLEGTGTLSGTAPEALIETANTGDAVVFIVDANRTDETLSYRLQAMSLDGACKVTSAAIETTLTTAGAASADRLLDAALDELLRTAPNTETISICPVQTEAGYSSCAASLTDSLAAIAAARASDANRILTDRELRIDRPGQAACLAPGNDLRSVAQLSGDAQGRTWLDLEFRIGTQVISAQPRQQINMSVLGCDPTLRPLIDFISLTANTDRSQLDVTSAPMNVGERLDVAITVAANTTPYCWVIAPDETAFITLPAGDAHVLPQGTYSYPEDFGLRSIVLSEPFENLFHCFAPTQPLPEDLAARWTDASPTGANPRLLIQTDIAALLDDMRAQPGMIEAATRLIVR